MSFTVHYTTSNMYKSESMTDEVKVQDQFLPLGGSVGQSYSLAIDP